jgi:hypothetical protein
MFRMMVSRSVDPRGVPFARIASVVAARDGDVYAGVVRSIATLSALTGSAGKLR